MVKRLFVSIALIISCVAVSFGDVPNAQFASGGSALNIPFKIFNNHIYLHVSVNNGKPLWFLLDTGARNIINQRHARALGLKLGEVGKTAGVGEGRADSFVANNVSFSLPGLTVGRQWSSVISLENVEECSRNMDIDSQGNISLRARAAREDEAQPIDGVLGDEFFRLFVIEIDYVTKSINLYDPQSYRYQGEGERLPLEMWDNHIYVRATITASKLSPLTGLFMIDSGSATAVVLNSPFVDQNKLLPPPNQTTPLAVCGVGGESQTQIGKLTEIRLGKVKVENPTTMFSQAVNGTFGSRDFSGTIGNAVLRRFKVVFDYSRRLMILEPPVKSGS